MVTGTRAEYGLLTSTLAGLRARRDCELQLVVTGMHLLPRFGRTVREIERDGWPIAACVPMQRGDDDALDVARGLGRGVAGIAEALTGLRSEIVVVLGDRIEALAGALAGVSTSRVVAHIHGGDVAPGDFDDSMRHAITKLAHLHLAATRNAAKRIVRLGEDPERVHVVGAPGLDDLGALLAERAARSRRTKDLALVVQHPCGRPAAVERRVMSGLLEAVRRVGLRCEIIHPNSDRGHSGIVAAIERFAARRPANVAAVHRSLPRKVYLEKLCDAAVIVGNSSSGIIEAPLAATPSVSVGDRQLGREPGGRCVSWCAETPAVIERALRNALSATLHRPRRTVYGDGRAGERIVERLVQLCITPQLLRKRITY